MQQPQIAIKICLGSACYARGSREILDALKAYIAEHPLENTVTLTGSLCEDSCRKGPVITINGTQYTGVNAEQVIELLEIELHKLDVSKNSSKLD